MARGDIGLISPFGQDLDPVEVVVLIRERDGTQHGWRVDNVNHCSWSGGAEAVTVTVKGRFYRKMIDDHSVALAAEMNRRAANAFGVDRDRIEDSRRCHPSAEIFADRDDDVIEYEAPKRLGRGPGR